MASGSREGATVRWRGAGPFSMKVVRAVLTNLPNPARDTKLIGHHDLPCANNIAVNAHRLRRAGSQCVLGQVARIDMRDGCALGPFACLHAVLEVEGTEPFLSRAPRGFPGGALQGILSQSRAGHDDSQGQASEPLCNVAHRP